MALVCLSAQQASAGKLEETMEYCKLQKTDFNPLGEPLENKDCSNPLEELTHGKRAAMDAPYRPPCKLEWRAGKQACGVLKDTQLQRFIFLGDSVTRQLYDAMLVTLRDDVLAGALPDDAEDEVKNECGCAVSFSEGRRRCKRKVASFTGGLGFRLRNVMDAWRSWFTNGVCNNALVMDMMHVYKDWQLNSSRYAHLTFQDLEMTMRHAKGKVFVFLGGHPMHPQQTGSGQRLDAQFFCNELLTPVVNLYKKYDVPLARLLVSNFQHMQTEKFTPTMVNEWGMTQTVADVQEYNRIVGECAAKAGVKVFDSFAMTENTSTTDGLHLGLAPNALKAQTAGCVPT